DLEGRQGAEEVDQGAGGHGAGGLTTARVRPQSTVPRCRWFLHRRRKGDVRQPADHRSPSRRSSASVSIPALPDAPSRPPCCAASLRSSSPSEEVVVSGGGWGPR